jgi:hypothetical protein
MEFRIYPVADKEIYPYPREFNPSGNYPNLYKELVLTNNVNYGLMSIEGIDPADCTINSSHLVGVNGEIYNSSFLNGRNITITLAINSPAEENRRNLFQTCRVNKWLGMEFRLDDMTLFISGIIKQIPTTYFDKKEVCQIMVYCPSPEFKRIALPHNPQRYFSIPLNGEEVEFRVNGDLPTYPFFQFETDTHRCSFVKINKRSITTSDENQLMKIEYDFPLNYYTTINCRPSERQIMGCDLNTNNGEQLLAYLSNDSSWIAFDQVNYYGWDGGDRQTYRVSAEDDTGLEDGQTVRMEFYDLYQGV